MCKESQESNFTKFYLWMTAAKITMGLFFVFFVFMYLLLGLISEGPIVTLDFFTSLEMVFAAFFIGIVQQLLLPDSDRLSKLRGLLWILSSTLITFIFALVFKWFEDFPIWCFIVFISFTAIGIGAMMYRYHLQLMRETRQLNERLKQFQEQRK